MSHSRVSVNMLAIIHSDMRTIRLFALGGITSAVFLITHYFITWGFPFGAPESSRSSKEKALWEKAVST